MEHPANNTGITGITLKRLVQDKFRQEDPDDRDFSEKILTGTGGQLQEDLSYRLSPGM